MTHIEKRLGNGIHLHTINPAGPTKETGMDRFYTRELPNGKYLAWLDTPGSLINGAIAEGLGTTRRQAIADLIEHSSGFDPRFIYDESDLQEIT